MMQDRTIRIRLLRHDKTGLFMAVSQDLKGLVVHGKSVEEIDERLPSIVRDLLEADGHSVANVELVEDVDLNFKDFGPPAFLANVFYRTAA